MGIGLHTFLGCESDLAVIPGHKVRPSEDLYRNLTQTRVSHLANYPALYIPGTSYMFLHPDNNSCRCCSIDCYYGPHTVFHLSVVSLRVRLFQELSYLFLVLPGPSLSQKFLHLHRCCYCALHAQLLQVFRRLWPLRSFSWTTS